MVDSKEDVSTLRNRANDFADNSEDAIAKNPKISTNVHGELAEGCTYDGVKFLVPKTADTVAVFTDPKHMNIGTVVALVPVVIMFLLSFVVKVPIAVNIIVFFIFRACYNAGLGYLLNVQSKYNQLTKWYIQYTKDPKSASAYWIRRFVVGGLPAGYKPEDFPPEFNAWIVYKAVVNASLIQDSSNYSWLAIRCYTMPEEFSFLLLVQYGVAVLLFVFNWWAKVDAHRCIGTYCWYWGDFFYRKNVSLTFDGIFELFPHPMYTVGYSIYYATALFTRSYTVLLVSLIAHMSQLIFLVVVEEPHIKKIYGDGEEYIERDEKALYDAEKGWFPSKSELMFFFSLDFFNSGTWSLIFGVFYVFFVALLPSSPVWAVLQVLLWRFIHWGILGFILWQQSTRSVWTRHFERRGRSLQDAFGHWKRIYNVSSSVNICVFVACTLRHLPSFTFENICNISYFAKFVAAICLCLLSLWTSYSTYKSVGDFGWFYGDFFIAPSQYRNQLCYTGIYRFLNNPDAVTGYAGLYGLALLCDGWVMFILALLSQVLNMIFINVVEIPHMRKLYDSNNNTLRQDGPLSVKFKTLLKDTLIPSNVDDKFRTEMKVVKNKTLTEVYNIYKKVASKRVQHEEELAKKDKKNKTTLNCPRTISMTSRVEVTFETHADHADTDWVGLYKVDTPSQPGLSDGKWLYVPEGASGTLQFNSFMLPKEEGVYEFRYFRKNTYDVIASKPIIVTNDQEYREEMDSLSSPVLRSNPSEASEVNPLEE